MRHTIQLIVLFALVACQAIGQQTGNGVKVALKMQPSRWILGEDPQITEVWTNTGDKPVFVAYGADPSSRFNHIRLIGPLRKDCETGRRMVEEGGVVPNPPKLAPGKVLRVVHSLHNYGCVDAGHYEAWIEYDTTNAPGYYREADLAILRLESNHVEFDIVAAQGTDAEVLSKHGNKCSQVTLTPQELIEKYPASTYAGYVIAKKLLDLSDWRFKVGTPASAIQAGKEHPEWATRSQSDVELFNLVEKHIQGGNVPESLRAVLYCYYGEQLILRGRAAEAEAAFCQAVKEKPGDAKGEAYFTRAQQFLDALNKHGA
jgi:hypothetical protein